MSPSLKMFAIGILVLAGIQTADANILVNPPFPYTQNKIGATGYTVYYGGNATASVSSSTDTAAFFNKNLFRIINTSDNIQTDVSSVGPNAGQNNWLWFDITSDLKVPAGASTVITLSTGTTANSNEIPIRAASQINSSSDTTVPAPCGSLSVQNCQGLIPSGSVNQGLYVSANYTPGSIMRVAVSLHDLCTTTGAGTDLCGTSNAMSYTNLANANMSQTINVTVGTVPNNTVYGPISATPIASPSPAQTTTPDTFTFTLSVSDLPPSIQCPTTTTDMSKYYFPGDSQIYLQMANFTPIDGSGPPVVNYLIYGKIDAAPATGLSELFAKANSFDQYIDVTGTGILPGFKNTDASGSSNKYQLTMVAQNQAGVVNGPSLGCVFPSFVQSQTISGVLTESKCFIATAAFQDGRAAPVMLLRRFRDAILSNFDFGKSFIRTYYHYSPALAEWAWDKPIVRSFALRLLAPVELAAWLALKIAGAAEDVKPTESYSEMLKKKLLEKDAKEGKTPESGSYSENLRKEIGEKPAEESYTEQEKRKLKEKENSSGYVESERAKLPPEKNSESPIKMVKENRDVIPKPERPPIKNGFGFKMGIVPGIDVTNSNGTHTFKQVYGSDWNPDFMLHYERQLFHSENFGSFGVGLDTGLTYASGYGLLQAGFNGSKQSQTQFTFYQVPFLISGEYRFNLFRLLRPYAMAGAGTMLYSESRKDSVPGFKGYAFIWEASLGVALLMDFLDSATALDAYMSEGIQHVYLLAEYEYLDTFSGAVAFHRNGVYTGFLFEF